MTAASNKNTSSRARTKATGRKRFEGKRLPEGFDPAKPLRDPRREKFCQYMTKPVGKKQRTQTASAVDAGYSKRSAAGTAVMLLNCPDVAARVEWLQTQSASAAVMSRTEALEILTAGARRMLKANNIPAAIADFVTMKNGEAEVQDFTGETPGAGAICEVETRVAIEVGDAGPQAVRVTKVKTASPVEYIDGLARLQGWNAAAKLELNSTGKAPVIRVEFVEATKADAQKAKAAD